MKTSSKVIGFIALLLVGMATAKWPALQFSKLNASEFASRLGVLLVFTLLIERTVEVFLTLWRAEESGKRETKVKRLIAEGRPATDADLRKAQDELQEYKAATLRSALPLSFAMGFLLACFGVRLLSQFVVLPPAGLPGAPDEGQLLWFHLSDIVFTATMLAGGADPIHKLLDVFRKFMEASAARAAGTAK
jgi:hypothetical protein